MLLAIGLAAGVAFAAWRFSGPSLSAVDVAWTPAGPVLEFTRAPAGPAALVIESPGQTRTLATTSPDGVHHALALVGLLPGQRVTAVPLAGGCRGAPVRVISRASALAGLEEREEPDGALTVRFASLVPARCRVQVEAAHGAEWLPWEPDAGTAHAIGVPASLAPVRGAVAIQVETGEDARVEPIAVEPATRVARRIRLADALEHEIAPHVREEEIRRRKRLPDAPPPPLPRLPAWLAAELGGPGGALDDRMVPPRRKDALYRALVWLADHDRARPADARAGWAELPRARDFGPSLSARYPEAVRVPLDGDRDRTRPMPLWSQDTRAKDLPAKLDPFAIVGKPELDRLGADARVELHARATLPRGRWLSVSINGFYEVRLGEPGAASSGPRDLWVALDPAYFITGYNVVRITTDGGPGADRDAPAVIEPPGLEVCVNAR